MENWRGFLNEAEEGPTVGEFLASWQKQNPKSIQKIFGKAAKWVVGLTVGAAAGTLAGGATAGVGAAAGVAAGAAAGKLSEEAVNQLFGFIAGKASGGLAKFMISMSERQVPDDQRSGIDLYYDLDDEYEALLQSMDSDLANAYQEKLYVYFENAFSNMGTAEPTDLLKDYIAMTANDFLQRFLQKKSLSGVGIVARKLPGR